MSNGTKIFSLDFFLFKGLSRTLFLGFLFFALVPLAVMAVFSYQNSISSLRTGTIDRLQDALELNHLFLEAYLRERQEDVLYQSTLQENILFWEQLNVLYQKKKLSLRKFINLPQYNEIVTSQGSFLHKYLENSIYSDVFLVNSSGNVLHSFKGAENCCINIFTGAENEFARICRKTFEKLEPAFSDVTLFGSSENTKAMFIAQVMVNDAGEKLGALVFQLDVNYINNILDKHVGLGETGRTYLVADDKLMRSMYRSHVEGHPVILNADSDLVKFWLAKEQELHGKLAREGNDNVFYKFEKASVYHGPCGETVLGAARNFDFMERHGVHWLMVAEMHEDEAFAAIKNLKRIMTATFLTTFFLVLFFAFFITRQVVRPVRQLTDWATDLSSGDLTNLDVKTPDNEIGALHQAFTNMVNSSRLIEKQALLIAQGKTPENISPRSERDSLSYALNDMLDSLRSIVSQALIIAEGDYTRDFVPRSGHDKLSIAIESMTKKLRKTDLETRGQMSLNEKVRGEYSVDELSEIIISFMAGFLNAMVGALYVMEEDLLRFTAGYAYTPESGKQEFRLGEGLIGQAAREGKTLLFQNVPKDCSSLIVNAGMAEYHAHSLLVIPLMHGKQIIGVMEFGKNSFISESEKVFAEKVAETIAISIHSASSRQKMTFLLQETQEQKKILEKQTEALSISEEELQGSNTELSIKTAHLETQHQELMKAKLDLEEKARELEKASSYKSEFLANMSHELRSPLNSMLILARCLADNEGGNLSERQVQDAKIICKGGHDLLYLINDILDLSKVEAGKIDINLSEVNLSLLLEELEEYYAPLAAEKKIEFKTSIAPAVPKSIISDERRLGQILKNLLSNAIKFTSHGSVTVSLMPGAGDSHLTGGCMGEKLIFEVSDTGIGIPVNKQQIVFEAFEQVDGSSSRSYDGTGLGLNISQKLAKLLGGEITLQSVQGQGTVFSLHLPLELCLNNGRKPIDYDALSCMPGTYDRIDGGIKEEKKAQQKGLQGTGLSSEQKDLTKEESEIVFQGQNVLVVDDDMRITFALGNLLRKRGMLVELAADGRQALDKLARLEKCDIVLMDIMMPDMDGYETMRKIRSQKIFKELPIIALTAKARTGDRRLCLDAGANDYLSKPLDENKLIAMINDIFVKKAAITRGK